jgi:hypothetical protein
MTAAMATRKQTQAAKRNVKKAQAAWQAMSHGEHARAQPQGRGRTKPGTKGGGEFYRIQVRPKGEFVTFRTQDVGGPGHIERVAGKRGSGSWARASSSPRSGALASRRERAEPAMTVLWPVRLA